jgi:lysyl-tRNA synthetase class 1
MAIMLPSLREERAQTYSPFLPIDPQTGVVLQVPVVNYDAGAGTITYEDPQTSERVTISVTGGRAKLQWKPDWAMRWVALGIDYEMAGKDLIDSMKLSGEICRALGGAPPEGFNYQLFLDEKGQKISKSKGNGLTIEEWLRYANPESLSLFMYREPKAAKRLYFDVIPRNVDEYHQLLEGYQRQDDRQQLSNPVWHIHSGDPPEPGDMPIAFSMLLTLVSSSNAENADTLWGFIRRYRPGVTPKTHPKLDAMVGYAIHYFRDFVLPTKTFREPNEVERAALSDLRDALSQLPADASAEQIQDVVYEIGRREPFLDHKKAKDGKPGVSLEWFHMLYQVLLGQEKGPRFGSFVAVYGLANTIEMIDGALARSA